MYTPFLLSVYNYSQLNLRKLGITNHGFCFRREEVREKLRQQLELEKRAQKVVERLLEDSVTEDFLVDCVCISLVQFYSEPAVCVSQLNYVHFICIEAGRCSF